MSVDVITWAVNKGAENVAGRIRSQYFGATLSSSYPSGGYTLPVLVSTQYGQLGIRTLLSVFQRATNTAGIAYTCTWDSQAGKLHIFTAGAEVAGSTNLSTIQLHLKLEGTR